MIEFKSDEQSIPYGVQLVYPVLSDLRTLDELKDNPNYEKVQDLRFERDVCFLSLSPIGEIILRVIERIENKCVKLKADDTLPFKLFLNVNIKSQAENKTNVQLVIDADLSPILRMIASPAINDFLKKATLAIANLNYSTIKNGEKYA